MEIGLDEVRRVAKLARIAFSEDDLLRMARELDGIVTWIDKLKSLETSEVEVASHILPGAGSFREDVCRPSLPACHWTHAAPRKAQDAFEVPRVVE